MVVVIENAVGFLAAVALVHMAPNVLKFTAWAVCRQSLLRGRVWSLAAECISEG